MRAQMFRDITHLIETQLVSETLANLNDCWRNDLTLEQNLNNAALVTSANLESTFDDWMLSRLAYDKDIDEPDDVHDEEVPPMD
jgi:hypothetical protein